MLSSSAAECLDAQTQDPMYSFYEQKHRFLCLLAGWAFLNLLPKLRVAGLFEAWNTKMETEWQLNIKSDMQPASIHVQSVWIFGKIIIETVMGAYGCFHIAFEVGALSCFPFLKSACL